MAREVLRTKTFASDAANFILTRARESIDERHQFRIALSGGNMHELSDRAAIFRRAAQLQASERTNQLDHGGLREWNARRLPHSHKNA